MLQRTEEPELMEDAAQAAAYAHADFASPNAAFVERLLAEFPALAGHVLDLGCGPADIPVRLCARGATLTFTAVDGSAAMLAHAARAVRGAGLADRVRLVCARLPGGVPDAEPYDAVISNSLLHHLPDPAVLWREVRRLARPGAPVFVGDLRRPATGAQVDALVDEHSAGEPPVLRRDFRASLHAAFTVDEVRAQLVAAGLPHLQVAATSDRHLAVWGRL